MVEWKETYATGVKDIDDQHKDLFDYINQLEVCIEEGVYSGPRIEIILNFLQMFCSTHFCLEESCMRQRKCSVQEKNKKAHDKFLAYFKAYKSIYAKSYQKKNLIIELHSSLIKWLVNHIVKIDMRIKTCKVIHKDIF